MATYGELYDFLSVENNTGLRQKVVVAAFIKADTIRQETDGTAAVAQRKRYAQSILASRPSQSFISRPDGGYALTPIEAVYRAVLIANASATVSQINAASDAAIQTNVDTAIDFLAAEFPDPP